MSFLSKMAYFQGAMLVSGRVIHQIHSLWAHSSARHLFPVSMILIYILWIHPISSKTIQQTNKQTTLMILVHPIQLSPPQN